VLAAPIKTPAPVLATLSEKVRTALKTPDGLRRWQQGHGLEVIAMDEFAIQKGHRHATQRPNAAIVFDLSHIIAKYGRVVIDRVRGRSSERTARRSASPQARQGCALAAAEESQLDASRGGHRARRTARQP
jgi:hypothetical protein